MTKKKPLKTYRITAECEVEAATQKQAKRVFLTALRKDETLIFTEEAELTEPNIDMSRWMLSDEFQARSLKV